MAAPGKEPEANEDAIGIFPLGDTGGLLAVADGVGGHAEGGFASRTVLEALWDATSQRGESQSLRAPILDALEATDARLRERGSGAATTLVAAEIAGGELRAYHAGDSSLLVVGGRGKIKLQTVPHSPVGYALEAGLLPEREARRHADRHLISNAVGLPDMRIEVGSPLALAARDTVVLASDGIADNLTVAEIAESARKRSLVDAAAELASRVRRRMEQPSDRWPAHPDDVSIVLFRLGPPGRA